VVDLDEATILARALLEQPGDVTEPVDRELLMHDVLPGLDEEWLIVPRERHRQRRLHALEALAHRDVAEGRPLDAVDTALAAVAAEPLRESAQLLVVQAHLAAGNRAAALEQYERFRALLAAEMQLEPSPQLVALAEGARGLPVTAP
jgi:DNA-binding SARP family transcriptional activator